MGFKSISLSAWRQFRDVEIEFHDRLTILTGANGAGKTSILKILSQHFGWSGMFLATPSQTSSGLKYDNGVYALRKQLLINNSRPVGVEVGKIVYRNDSQSEICVSDNTSVSYQVFINNQRSVKGLYIGSHRVQQNYRSVSSIPTGLFSAELAYDSYSQELMRLANGDYGNFSPVYKMKECIVSMATFGLGNSNVQGNEELEKLFNDFKAVLSKVLPSEVGFKDVVVRLPDVVLLTNAGDFILDAASGGLSALIDLAWQVFLFSHKKNEYCVVIDEPENHLHPSMQRTLLPRLMDAFPAAQFIVATHSPFVVSSVRDSVVYALKYVKANSKDSEIDIHRNMFVQSIKLDLDGKAATAAEILRDVLGVPVTLPEWAEDNLKGIINEMQGKAINESFIASLRERLSQNGLGEYLPQALSQVLGNAYD